MIFHLLPKPPSFPPAQFQLTLKSTSVLPVILITFTPLTCPATTSDLNCSSRFTKNMKTKILLNPNAMVITLMAQH